ncbi:MAG: hypothetical protein KDH94_04885, partial [Coxiellaceae bacterium]|nr:hypothetical protein [Coxiellaceae bacterium]
MKQQQIELDQLYAELNPDGKNLPKLIAKFTQDRAQNRHVHAVFTEKLTAKIDTDQDFLEYLALMPNPTDPNYKPTKEEGRKHVFYARVLSQALRDRILQQRQYMPAALRTPSSEFLDYT